MSNRRFLLGFAFGLALGITTLLIIGSLIPNRIDEATASSFFLAATGVNATLLVAIAVTISAILNRTPDRYRKSRMLFFIVQLIVVFIGLVISGVGILAFNPEAPLNLNELITLVNLVFTTWVIGFVLLIAGIWTLILPSEAA